MRDGGRVHRLADMAEKMPKYGGRSSKRQIVFELGELALRDYRLEKHRICIIRMSKICV